MPLYAGKYAICAFLQNMRNMLRLHDRCKPVSLISAVLLSLAFGNSIHLVKLLFQSRWFTEDWGINWL